MADCTIVKESYYISWSVPSTKLNKSRRWIAICPDCKISIKPDYTRANTRKAAKDDLHRHRKVKH